MKKLVNLIELDVSSMLRTILTVAITFLTYVLSKSVIITAVVGVLVLLLINTLGLAKKFRYGASILAVILMLLACIFTHATLNNVTKDDHVCEPEVITINTCKCTCEGCVNGGECLCMNKDNEEDKTGSGEGNGKVTQNRNYGTNNGSKDKLTPTYHNTEGDSNNGGGTTVIKGQDNTDFGDTTNNDQNAKEENKLKEEGKEVVAESDNGIKAWTDTTDDSKKDDDKVNDDKKEADSVSKSEMDKAEVIPNDVKDDKKSDSNTDKTPHKLTIDEINNLSTTKPGNGNVSIEGNTNQKPLAEENKKEEETSLNKVDTTTPSTGNTTPETPKVEEKPAQGTTPNTENVKVEDKKPVEETKPVVTTTPVSITPLDGNTAFAGDTVQFRVSGDVKSVEGMDGVDYTMGSGVLSVQTNPQEATVISPTLVGEDGSTASATVTVNALNFNN